jgi:hypothetical protein
MGKQTKKSMGRLRMQTSRPSRSLLRNANKPTITLGGNGAGSKVDTARQQFIDNLRVASRSLRPPAFVAGPRHVADLASALDSADLWLTQKSVEGFHPADFRDLPELQQQKLKNEVASFLAVARSVPANKAATRAQSNQARKHLEQVIQIVGSQLREKWLKAHRTMLEEATAAAKTQNWHVQEDEKEVLESLLGRYKAPRLLIQTPDRGVVLDPIARFGSGRRGIVDLVLLPTYETAYLVTFKDDEWQIVSARGTMSRRPFSGTTLVNTIAHMPN